MLLAGLGLRRLPPGRTNQPEGQLCCGNLHSSFYLANERGASAQNGITFGKAHPADPQHRP
jgi:hypothetical protein